MVGSFDAFSFLSVLFRLLLAAVCGGLIGFERSKKDQPAGLRTYTICCVAAALATLTSFYVYEMLTAVWAEGESLKFDGSRYAAAVLSGIGFLAAGSIVRAAHQQITGLTTAIGVFVDVCMGIAIGAGFYAAVIGAFVMLIIVFDMMGHFEGAFKRRTRNLTMVVNFEDILDLDTITEAIRNYGAEIYEFDLEETGEGNIRSAVIWTKLPKENSSHSLFLTAIAQMPCVESVQELIA